MAFGPAQAPEKWPTLRANMSYRFRPSGRNRRSIVLASEQKFSCSCALSIEQRLLIGFGMVNVMDSSETIRRCIYAKAVLAQKNPSIHEWSKRICMGWRSCKALPTERSRLTSCPRTVRGNDENVSTAKTTLPTGGVWCKFGRKAQRAPLVIVEEKTHRKG